MTVAPDILAAGQTMPGDPAADQGAPGSVEQRLALLHAQGGQYLDPALQATLANSNQSNSGLTATVHAITQTVGGDIGSLVKSVRTVFEDPVLYKQPTAALRLHQFVTQQMGWLPVAQVDLTKIQQQLQKSGYGKDLSLSGVWTSDWQNVFHQASQDHFDQQRSSDAGKGFSIGSVLHGFLSSMMPSHAVPAIIGAVKSLPAGVRQLAADSAGMATQLGSDVYHGDVTGALGDVGNAVNPVNAVMSFAHAPKSDAARSAGAFVENIGNRTPVTADQFAAEHNWRRAVDNVNTILSVTPLFKLGGAVADAGGQAIARGLSADTGKASVTRGPGLISNMLYRPAGYYATHDGVDYVKSDAGLLAARAFDHMPFLGQMMPAVRMGVENGQRYWYYTARPFAAAPYRIPLIQAAGHIGQQVMFTGALLRGDANVVNKIEGGHSQFAKTLAAQHPYSGPVGMALDLLGSVAHGSLINHTPMAARSAEEAATLKPAAAPAFGLNPSEQVGDVVRKGMAAYDAMLVRPGVIGAMERGTAGQVKFDDLIRAAQDAGLHASDVHWHYQSKLDELAAAHGANEDLRASDAIGLPRQRAVKQRQMEIRQSADDLRKWRGVLVDSDAALANRFAMDYNKIIQNPAASKGDIVGLMKARRPAYDLINDPNLAWQNIHSGTFAALKDAQAEREFARVVAKQTPEGPEPALTAGWLRANNPGAAPAALGIARTDRILRGDALQQATEFERQLTKIRHPAGAPPEVLAQDTAAMRTLRSKMGRYLVELGIDSHSVPDLPSTADGMLALIRDRADDLAEKVAQPLNPTAEYVAKRKELNDLGYELVHGTGIGFEFTNPVIDPVVVDGQISFQRKMLDKLGLSPTYADTHEASIWPQLATIRAWQKLSNDGKVAFPPGYTPATFFHHVYDNRSLRLTGPRGAVFKGAERIRWRRMVASENPGATEPQIDEKLAAVEKELAGQRSMADMSPAEFVAAGSTPPRWSMVNEMRDLAPESPLFDEPSLRLLYTSMIGAVNKKPAWMFGASKLEDVLRAGGASFAGQKVANNRVLRRAATVGNDYVRFRNTYRFGIDPTFSARRITKSYAKLGTVGVPASIHLPHEAMIRQGTLADDMALANRLFPVAKTDAEGMDALDRTVSQADLTGLFNPRHFIGYGAGWLKRQGLTDDEIKAKVTQALTYGERSALERTFGTIFYPFSFEKTLYRQFGRVLLDEPGQRFMAMAALQAWDALNKNDRIGHWATAHAPVLTELQKLNAFEHGLGPGTLGGINAPLASATWNLFGPQQIGDHSNHAYKVIAAAIPAISELNSLLVGYSPTTGDAHGGTVTQQAGIAWQEARNRVDDATRSLFHDPRSPWNPQAPAETFQAQQDSGYGLRNHLIVQWASVIDYNYHHRGSEVRFPTDGSVPDWLAGQTVTKSTIDELVHRFYPAYDPTRAQTLAVAKKTEENRFLASLGAANPDHAAAFSQFAKQADRFITYKNQSELDPAAWGQLAGWTEKFRQFAVALSEQNPKFASFYRRYYSSQLGPLEALTG